MKKFLLPLFGGLLLTTSVTLTTGQNVDTAIKLQEKQEAATQDFFNQGYSINSQSAFSETQIKAFQATSQKWDDQTIGNVLNKALKYQNGQLTINKKKLDRTKLPLEILENIDLALANLNNAVTVGFINVNVTNNMVQLNYSDSATIDTNSEIVYFDSQFNDQPSASTFSRYMWLSAYGPSKWWKFWEWGGFWHFNELAVFHAKFINIAATVMSIVFLFKNIHTIATLLTDLNHAWNISDSIEVGGILKALSDLVGFDLGTLGDVIDIILFFTAVTGFGIALITGGSWAAPLVQLVLSIIASVTGKMVKASKGNGVKWRWVCFVVPNEMLPE